MGLFVTIEGSDGVGKTTQLQNIKYFFAELKLDVLFTREPGGTKIGEAIRDILLNIENDSMSAMTEALLYAAARSQHVSELIKPALHAGKIVVSDRYIDSSIAYQAYGRQLGTCVKVINEFAIDGLLPNYTIFINLSPKDAETRISQRTGIADRIEQETLEFKENVYRGYMEQIQDDPRFIVIDGNQSEDDVWNDIRTSLIDILSDHGYIV